jgi:amino acid transporter
MSSGEFRKAMGLGDLILFYLVTALSLRWIATAAASGPSSLCIWVLGCIGYFIPLVFCVLELSSRMPDEGGIYVWTKHAFGEFAGFMTGWMYWTANLPYYPGLLYFAAGNVLFAGGEQWQNLSTNSIYFIVFALLGLALGFVLNLVGLDVGKWLHNIGAVGTWVPALMLIVMGGMAWFRFGSATEFSWTTVLPIANFKNVLFWSTVAFAFGGVEGASTMSEEIRNPRRNIPVALLAAGVIITVIYLAGTASVLVALPADEASGLQGFMQALSQVAARMGMAQVAPFVAVLVTISSIGGVSAWFAASARIPFVAGVDRFLPQSFGRLHSKWRTPYIALGVQALIAAFFIFLGQAGTSVKGAYEFLVSVGVLSYFLPFLFMFSAMIRVQAEPAGPEVIRVPGGKPTAILLAICGLLTTIISSVLACIPPADEPNKLLAVAKVILSSATMVGIGAAVYWVRRPRTLL